VEVLLGVGERVECDIEALLAAPVGLVVGFGRHEPEQLIQVVVGDGQDDPMVVGPHREHPTFAVGVQQQQLAQRSSDLVGDDNFVDRTGESERSAAQIAGRLGPSC
jgi:hypothetical protein